MGFGGEFRGWGAMLKPVFRGGRVFVARSVSKLCGAEFVGALLIRPEAVEQGRLGRRAVLGNRGALASVGAERACRGQAGATRFDACQIG